MKSFVAAVDENYLNRIEDVADRLRTRGCKIENILKLTGVITGRVSLTTEIAELKIEGIESVEVQKKIRKADNESNS